MDSDKKKQGTSQAEDSSAQTGQTSKEPETLTQEKMVEKAVSDALAKAGRTAKSLSELETRLNTGMAELTTKQTAWQKKQDEAEEEAVMDNPEALATLRAERRKKADDETKVTELTEREAKLATRETELADIVERDKVLRRTELAAEVAVERGVSIDAILKLAKADTREAYLEVAEVLPKVKELPVLLSDSGRTNRGGIDWRALSPSEQVKYALEHQK